jgi:uncharacterized protein (DUF697 family)
MTTTTNSSYDWTKGADRQRAILNGVYGTIIFDSNKVAQGQVSNAYNFKTFDVLGDITVATNLKSIEANAKKYNIDVNLLKAIIYLENSHGWYDVGHGSSGGPGNIKLEVWAPLIGMTPAQVSASPAINVELAAKLLSEIKTRLANPTSAAIATLYNSMSQDMILGYGLTIEQYMKDKAWENNVFTGDNLTAQNFGQLFAELGGKVAGGFIAANAAIGIAESLLLTASTLGDVDDILGAFKNSDLDWRTTLDITDRAFSSTDAGNANKIDEWDFKDGKWFTAGGSVIYATAEQTTLLNQRRAIRLEKSTLNFNEANYCFPADTEIMTSATTVKPICDIRVGDVVMAFDPHADLGRGALVPRKVTRLYSNTTQEWIKLTWQQSGDVRELITTPNHPFLDQFGNFSTIETMLENNQATLVSSSGELVNVSAERIFYSKETAHLFEQAQLYATCGNASLKPEILELWKSYNFEVEELHTYFANDMRVHNECQTMSKALGDSYTDLVNGIKSTVNATRSYFLGDVTRAKTISGQYFAELGGKIAGGIIAADTAMTIILSMSAISPAGLVAAGLVVGMGIAGSMAGGAAATALYDLFTTITKGGLNGILAEAAHLFGVIGIDPFVLA